MILYCDTSALVKFYFSEKHSQALLACRQEAEVVAISVVGYAEFFSATNRKKREGRLDLQDCRRVVKIFNEDWLNLVRIAVTDDLNGLVARLLDAYPLRGFDAIHLASAVLLKDRLKGREIRFATLDDRQRLAARQEGFTVLPAVSKGALT